MPTSDWIVIGVVMALDTLAFIGGLMAITITGKKDARGPPIGTPAR